MSIYKLASLNASYWRITRVPVRERSHVPMREIHGSPHLAKNAMQSTFGEKNKHFKRIL